MANTMDFTSARSVVTSVCFCPESATISPTRQRVLFEQNQNQDVQDREEAAAADGRTIFPFPPVYERNYSVYDDEGGEEEWEDVTSDEDEEDE